MILSEFQDKARNTAIYLQCGNNRMIYPALGLIGECGEVSEKIKKLIRDANNEMTQERRKAIAKELGDCCWYLANIGCDTDISLQIAYDMRGSSLIQQARAMELPQLVVHMNCYATYIAKALETWHYEFKDSLTNKWRFVDISKNMSVVIACIEEIGRRCEFTLGQICAMNIDKLTSRKDRGVLGGDGDNR